MLAVKIVDPARIYMERGQVMRTVILGFAVPDKYSIFSCSAPEANYVQGTRLIIGVRAAVGLIPPGGLPDDLPCLAAVTTWLCFHLFRLPGQHTCVNRRWQDFGNCESGQSGRAGGMTRLNMGGKHAGTLR
jgi:hypothetical protein